MAPFKGRTDRSTMYSVLSTQYADDPRYPHSCKAAASSMTSPSRSGVFSKGADRRVERFTESISFDHRLYAHDIAGSIAHAQMLAKVGLISAAECEQICQTLEAIKGEIAAGEFPLRMELEDIH